MSAKEQLENVRERERRDGMDRAQIAGFVGGSLALGALGKDGKGIIPADLGGIDTDFIIAGVAFWYGRKNRRSRRGQMARGVSFAAAGGGLRDLGVSLAQRF